jgi:hypothetical protein
MQNLTSIAEWAKSLGISRQQGYAAVKRCAIPATDGKVDARYATHLYNQGTRKRANPGRPDGLATGAEPAIAAGAGGVEPESKVPGYDSSRARREAAEAETAELRLAEMSGKFLLKADVQSKVFEVSRALRDGLMNCASRIAADVAALPTTEECEAVIEREHNALLESMAHALSSKLGLLVNEGSE